MRKGEGWVPAERLLNHLEDRDFVVNDEYILAEPGNPDVGGLGTVRATAFAADPDFAGFLVPRSGPGPALAVTEHTLRLLRALRGKGSSPRAGLAKQGSPAQLAGLVLDGILGLSTPKGPLTGPSAFYELFSDQLMMDRLTAHSSGLTVTGLRCGVLLRDLGPESLAWWLYRFNTAPVSPSRLRRLGRVIGAIQDLRRRTPLKGHTLSPQSERAGWLYWSRSGTTREDGHRFRHKVYISPKPEFTDEVVHRIYEIPSLPIQGFKVPSDARGLLRPDKIVLYHDTGQALRETLTILDQNLAGFPAQGTPFSAPHGSTGLLSWGVDPLVGEGSLGAEVESWRLWLTTRLASAICAMRSRNWSERLPPLWALALLRLDLDGVDPGTFQIRYQHDGFRSGSR